MTENVEKIQELIHEDHCWTIHELKEPVGISYGVCQEILTENLNMCRTVGLFVPLVLTTDQKQRCVNMCLELQEKANEGPPFISRIITGDESWKSPSRQEQQRCSRYRVQQRAYSLFFFSTWRTLFTMNLFLLPLQSILTFTVMFWDAWEKMCDKKDRNFGGTTTGSFITTCWPTHPWKPQSLWLTTWLSFPTLPTRWT
jgi:hypothetical protein